MENQDWTIEKSIERLLRVRASAHHAEASLKSIRAEGRKLITFFGADRMVRTIQPEEMITYLEWRAEGTRASSLRTIYGYVRVWIKFCQNASTGMRTDLTENWHPAKVSPTEHTFVPPEAIPKVFRIASDRHFRDRALVAILWYTGLRSAEVAGLTVGDVDMRGAVITAGRSKIHDIKRVQMDAELLSEMSAWLKRYAALIRRTEIPPDRPLIPALGQGFGSGTLRATPLSTRSMREVTREILITAGFEGRELGTHTFRRSAGTTLHDRLVEEGDADPLGKTGIFLGHNSRLSTEKYLNRGHDEATARVMAKRGLLSVRADPASTVSHATVIDIRSRRRFAG